MGRRGRPPYPDLLTPRQREVLELVRAGLGDQEIADRLGLSLAGAKYHVSEILSRLGVSSREEAAAWEPEAAPWWRRAGGLTLAVRAAGAAVVLAAVAGLAVLGWGALRTGGGDGTAAGQSPLFEDLGLPAPETEPLLTREQALVRAAQYLQGRVLAADAQATEAAALVGSYIGSTAYLIDGSGVAWVVRVWGRGSVGDPFTPVYDADPQRQFSPICSEMFVIIQEGSSTAMSMPGAQPTVADDEKCNGMPSREAAIVSGAVALRYAFHDQLPDEITADQVTIGQAYERFDEAGHFVPPPHDVDLDAPAWFVTYKGRFFDAVMRLPTPVPPTPRPTREPYCQKAYAIVAAGIETRVTTVPADDCR